jgi:hypothetical protein
MLVGVSERLASIRRVVEAHTGQLRGDLDRVGVGGAGDRKRRPLAGVEFDAVGGLDVDLKPVRRNDEGHVVGDRLKHRYTAEIGRGEEIADEPLVPTT